MWSLALDGGEPHPAPFVALWRAGRLTDTVVHVEGEAFPASRNVLAAGSAFFDGIFGSGMRDEHEPEVREMAASAFRPCLGFIYEGSCAVEEGLLEPVLWAAHFLGIKPLEIAAAAAITARLVPAGALAQPVSVSSISISARGPRAAMMTETCSRCEVLANRIAMEKTQKVEIKTDETTTAAVTVFEDRAEVTRLVSLSPSGAGTYELCVQGLPDKADEDSIRCKAAATYKGLTIQEVSFEVHVTTIEAAANGSEAELRAKIKELTAARSAAAAEQARSAERKAMLSTYVKGMLAPLTSAGGVAPPSAGSSLAKVEELLDFQETQAAKADAADLATAERLSALDAELEAARSALAQLSAPARMLPKKTTKSRDVTILLSLEGTAAAAPPSAP